MSTSYDAKIIYGFPFSYPLPYDPDFEPEQIAREVGAKGVVQHNAGCSNGGYPDYFMGVVVASIRDFTRGQAWKKLPQPNLDLALTPEDAMKVAKLARAMGKDVSECGFYLIGDAG